MIKLESVTRSYPMGKVMVQALKGVDIQIDEGQFVTVVGPSGAGKTTIMNILGLIDQPSSGQIYIDNQSIEGLSDSQLTDLRRDKLGFIFQSFNLIPVLSVFENIELPLLMGKQVMSRKERKERVDYLIKEVGLEAWRNHKPRELSGGQRQRVAIARALSRRPQIVIADEPTANLDSKTGDTILQLMKKINKEDKTTFVFSTHDAVIKDMSDHVIYLRDGLVEKEERGAGA